MIVIKKLIRPSKKSGERILPGKVAKAGGFRIVNVSAGEGWFVDRITPKKRKVRK